MLEPVVLVKKVFVGGDIVKPAFGDVEEYNMEADDV